MPIEFDPKKIFQIGDIEGFSPAIGSLASMMHYTRNITLGAANGLTVEQLDYMHDKKSNSIGMLLFHIAGNEKFYQNLSFKNLNGYTDAELDFWEKSSLEDREKALQIKGNNYDHYKNILNELRKETYLQLQRKDDSWLKEETNITGFKYPLNNWFIWFHVMEDEINHRGQISWLRKRLPI
jgi:uncharacterized damage-inducible protein DinB